MDILRFYSGPLDLPGHADTLILAQPGAAGDGFVVLADLPPGEGETLFNTVRPAGAGQYRGVALYAVPRTDLSLARLNDRIWVIAPAAGLQAVIDVHLGTRPDIYAGPLADYLDPLGEPRGAAFVYGLPGLYRPLVPPGSGAVSLRQATVASGAFDLADGALAGHLQFVSANAPGYVQRLRALLPAARPLAIDAAADRLTIDLAGLSPAADIRPLLKSVFFDMDAIDYSEAIVQGGNAPWMNFRVGEHPNSVFINFEFRDEARREAFAAAHLPAGFTLAPIRILATEEPRYFLVLNLYQSSGGLVQGARAEWSVFVHDPDSDQPSFLVVQAAAESIAADSVNLLTLPEPVSHRLEPDAIASYVGVVDKATGAETTYFSSSIGWPQARRVSLSREFTVANDAIFWGNGVADRGLYNATVYNRDAVLVDPATLSFTDRSRWAGYLNPQPVHALVYLNALDIAISPWWNLDADYLDVTPAYRQELIDFKNNFYPMTVLGLAEAAMRGEGSVLGAVTTADSVPTARFHFLVTDPAALFATLPAGEQFTPLAIALHDGDAPDYYLSLVVSAREDDPCGVRAEWVTYVRGETGHPQTLQLATLGSDACLDPVSLLGLPAVVAQEARGTTLTTRLQSPFVHFEAQLDLARTDEVLAGLDWLEAGDTVCAVNGVCDHFYYDGQLLLRPVSRLDQGAVDIRALATPWNDFIQARPAEVTVQRSASTYAVNPWKTVPAFGL
ncbi:MAG: hypothetical protein R3E50_06970 [Halioglobus sp.]